MVVTHDKKTMLKNISFSKKYLIEINFERLKNMVGISLSPKYCIYMKAVEILLLKRCV